MDDNESTHDCYAADYS